MDSVNSFEELKRKHEILEEKYNSLITRSPEGFYLADLEGNFLSVNNAMSEQLGIPKEKLLKMSIWDLIPEEFQSAFRKRFGELLKGNTPTDKMEYKLKDLNGNPLYLEARSFPYIKENKVAGFHGIARNITQSKLAELALAESEESYRNIFNTIADGLVISDFTGKFIDANPAFCEIYGYTHEEIINIQATELIRPDYHDVFGKFVEEIKNTGTFNGETIDIRKDGSEINMSVRGSIIYKNGKKHMLAIVRDITKEKLLDEELKRERDFTKTVLNAQLDTFFVFDPVTGRAIRWNTTFCKVSGYSDEEISSLQAPDAYYSKEDIGKAKNTIENVIETGSGRVELNLITKDGGEIPTEYNISLLKDEDGNPKYLISVGRDVSERKITGNRLHRINEQLEIRNEELDSFAHTVAHDLKNPLGVILNYSELLLEENETLSKEEKNEVLFGIANTGSKMKNIIKELLLLAEVRKSEIKTDNIDMCAVYAEARNRVENLIAENGVKINVDQNFPNALGYGPWIEEVWVNYLSNAVKYGGNPPTIKIGWESLPDKRVKFWIKDNGKGINLEDQSKLFTPFTRLEDIGTEGQGLGLSISRRIMDKLHGEVGVNSEKGKGSTFYFILPLSESSS